MSHTIHSPGKRNDSLDALRGIAILLMVLSGSIAFGDILPGWMYHAQVPPPDHVFNPDLPGITWVDLVFPFFLFSMGVAIPLALQSKLQLPNATLQVWWIALRRFLILTWFALFLYHMRAWVIHKDPQLKDQFLSILAFILLFFQLYRPQKASLQKYFTAIQVAAYIAGLILLYILPFHEGKGFDPNKSDIIIIVLANMAFFGTIIWWHTRNHPWIRVGILPFIMGIFLASKIDGSWNQTVFEFTPLPWMYKFYYLKYLFIIIPGTLAGEFMLQKNETEVPKKILQWVGLLLMALIILNISFLYARWLMQNLIVNVVILIIAWLLLRRYSNSLIYKLFTTGTYLLLLGLGFEAWEGGIKKDVSTYSYYFVTAGLANYLLVIFHSLSSSSTGKKINGYLATNGQNPMIAYVAGNLLLTPILVITGMNIWMNKLNHQPWTGFLKGVLFTGIVSLITYFFTRKKWFWRT